MLEVIRWFELQDSTFVGLNTSRPERMRADTLRSLNALGRDFRVEFDCDLLHMNESGHPGDVVASKIAGLRAFTRAGYRPGANGFNRLRSAHPGAIIQCPIDFLAPLVLAAPQAARTVLRMLAGSGISRFSVAWGHASTRPLVHQLQEWGYEVNLYAMADHESFLQAVLLLPRSLTADFNFPEWNYYGRGSGERRRYHRYPKRQSTAAAGTRRATAPRPPENTVVRDVTAKVG